MSLERFRYNDDIVKKFIIATIIWGIVGMLVGVIIAIQLFFRPFNFDLPWLTFGRLRPLHTNAIIFAFCLNGVFAGIYHSSQRLLKTRMYSDFLSKVHFWGWQLIIVLAAITLPLGLSTSKEYAELEWPIAILITLVWVVFAINYFMTIAVRREKVLYVSIWFYIATIISIALLHIVNHISLPVSLFKSYSAYSGVRDALVQWWYGHNAVAFVLTTPFLGMGYYYIPKLVNRPIYSYRLSILHFWSLIFIYMWAGPHHLQYTALPEWLQSLGVVFSVMLIAPSWGGGINFILTIKSAWKEMKDHPSIKFFLAAIIFYLIATLEGPILSFKDINRVAHYTDWIIAHVHGGALGWNGYLIFAMLYWLVPNIYKTTLYRKELANVHFWVSLIGILVYTIPMWIAGAYLGIVRESITDGVLTYPNYMEMAKTILPYHYIRAIGGSLYLIGFIIGAYILFKTIRLAGKVPDTEAEAAPFSNIEHNKTTFGSLQKAAENLGLVMGMLSLIAVSVGGIIQILPILISHSTEERIPTLKPYSPLELEGRDIYIREGCSNCHSQMVRTFKEEVMRYGPYSKAGEFEYDFPHLWGSKQTGPDLHRLGKKYGDLWHYNHMMDPTTMTPDSTMPKYDWLAKDLLNTSYTSDKLKVMAKLGVPYSAEEIENANALLNKQAEEIQKGLVSQGVNISSQSEMIALIAYLQRLGVDGNTFEQSQKNKEESKK
ncbi:cytochrome-c oxidase, cbb3-type subunit I [Fluviispira sanaruensis]|uniref:cytochrome-c oxidase n=1 Tax=Fluviispira sanaruensis TaxID=2493639 RepID=A0A4P2VPG0_FLUSA|nr:cytochrome-c oxidase, cbb3-type subunit I [Fluviispira sanaruensis]BBH53649.1 cytochrome C oxidase Cbb3 [Fluviispira sanaruensis]